MGRVLDHDISRLACLASVPRRLPWLVRGFLLLLVVDFEEVLVELVAVAVESLLDGAVVSGMVPKTGAKMLLKKRVLRLRTMVKEKKMPNQIGFHKTWVGKYRVGSCHAAWSRSQKMQGERHTHTHTHTHTHVFVLKNHEGTHIPYRQSNPNKSYYVLASIRWRPTNKPLCFSHRRARKENPNSLSITCQVRMQCVFL